MKIDRSAVQTKRPIPDVPVLVDDVKEEPVTLHFSDPHWMGQDVRLCHLGTWIDGDGTKDFSKVTCSACRKRGAWLYGWGGSV